MVHVPTQAGMRIMESLVGVAPRTISELTQELGVTRTAVTEQLDELVADGYVSRVSEKTDHRGRPQYRYEVTPKGMTRFFPENQHLLVPAVWSSLVEIGGLDLLNEVICKTSEKLSLPVKQNLPWRERVNLLVRKGGFDSCEFQPDGTALLTKRTCKFYSMYENSGTVCEIHLQTLARILGVHVTHVASRHENAPCCQFRVEKEERS